MESERAGLRAPPRPPPKRCCQQSRCWVFVEDFVAGLGRFGPAAANAAYCGRSLFQMPYFSKIARASANVERSGTVGPEPITSRSSPITSDKNQREQRRRISQPRELAALDPRDVFANAVDLVDVGAALQQQPRGLLFFRERDRGAGSGSRAEAPPEIRQMTRSSGPAWLAISRDAPRPSTPLRSGTGWPHSLHLRFAAAGAVSVFHVDQPAANALTEQSFDRARHSARWLCRRRSRRCSGISPAVAFATGDQHPPASTHMAAYGFARRGSFQRGRENTKSLPAQACVTTSHALEDRKLQNRRHDLGRIVALDFDAVARPWRRLARRSS